MTGFFVRSLTSHVLMPAWHLVCKPSDSAYSRKKRSQRKHIALLCDLHVKYTTVSAACKQKLFIKLSDYLTIKYFNNHMCIQFIILFPYLALFLWHTALVSPSTAIFYCCISCLAENPTVYCNVNSITTGS